MLVLYSSRPPVPSYRTRTDEYNNSLPPAAAAPSFLTKYKKKKKKLHTTRHFAWRTPIDFLQASSTTASAPIGTYIRLSFLFFFPPTTTTTSMRLFSISCSLYRDRSRFTPFHPLLYFFFDLDAMILLFISYNRLQSFSSFFFYDDVSDIKRVGWWQRRDCCCCCSEYTTTTRSISSTTFLFSLLLPFRVSVAGWNGTK